MKTLRTASLALSLLALASCAPTQEQYAQLQTAAQGSPAFRQALLKDCVSRKWPKSEIEAGAMILSVPPGKVQALTCKRLVNGIASGRLKYADVQQLMNKRGPTVNLIKIVQGR